MKYYFIISIICSTNWIGLASLHQRENDNAGVDVDVIFPPLLYSSGLLDYIVFTTELCFPSHPGIAVSRFHQTPVEIPSSPPPPLFPSPNSPALFLSRRWSRSRWSRSGNWLLSWSSLRCWCRSRGWWADGRTRCRLSPCAASLWGCPQLRLQERIFL